MTAMQMGRLFSRLDSNLMPIVWQSSICSRVMACVAPDATSPIVSSLETSLRAAGTAVLFTSHKLDEVAEISDHVTIMRDGAVVHSGPSSDITEDEMATAMVGRDVSDLYPPKPGVAQGAPEVLSVENLSVPGFARNVSFSLRQGEILGVGGLIGSGRTEVMEGLAGLRPATSDRVTLFGQPVQFKRPSDAQQAGLCYLTEDRKLRGLLLERGMRENLTLQNLHKFGGFQIGRAHV